MKNRKVWALLLLAALLLAACAPAAESRPTVGVEPPSEEEAAPPEEGEEMSSEVEVFSWWTAGGEAEGLAAMIEVFGQQYPDIEFINAAVAGGAGTNARAVLATRLSAGNPPDSWQGHAGQEIIGTYVAAGQIEPLNDLYAEQGMLDVMPAALIPQISQEGNIYSVPVNIHRANVMWYNPTVLSDNGIAPPTTWDEFLSVCATLEAAGATCLAMGEQWTSMHLLETVLLGVLGPEAYSGLWDGSTDWASPEVTSALETFNAVLDQTNSDASTLSWDQAAQLVADGDAAFTIMGDWAEGYFVSAGLAPEQDFGWAPAPGTDGAFQWLSDSFVLPVGAPHPDTALAWLTVAGSKEGQEAFNPIKGSICARTDCDPSLFDVYLQSAMQDWQADTIVGSLTHGVVANDAWKSEIDTALGLFLADRDVAAFQDALVTAYESAGM